ncbi:hypothetical protein LP316_01015 [Thalassotalea sp. LPB0316]|uniref:hypothetical protein n=1 Tax=Thalassotalea sp. LPB0316 TaxID=2769490 RepID=UPI0018689B99|nr:hypothetical protein [Thalassotalea sp. LPB0316]QOL25929.1 hypothetical protein LP316_01015 [Thalassotalea sp. LPB0316]
MKTLFFLAVTSMVALPAFANSKTEDVKDVTDAYIQQHSYDVQQALNKSVKQDIQKALSSFYRPQAASRVELVAQNSKALDELSEQVDIE